MELDPGNLIPVILILYVNIVDMIAINFAKGSHRSTNGRLFAIIDRIVTDNVRTYRFFVPAMACRVEYDFYIRDMSILHAVGIISRKYSVAGCTLLAQRNACTLGIVDDIIFYNPTFTPVRSDYPHLFIRRRSPLRSGLAHFKPFDGDIIQLLLIRIETGRTGYHLDTFLIGVCGTETSPDGRVFVIRFTIPKVGRSLRIRLAYMRLRIL